MKPSQSSGMALAGQEALGNMDLYTIVRSYIQTAVAATAGYKALVLDKETMKVCVTLFGRSELAENNVVHIERLDQNEGKQHPELKVGAYG